MAIAVLSLKCMGKDGNDAIVPFLFAIKQHADDSKKRDKNLLPFFLKIEMEFRQNGRWKSKNVRIHYRNAHFAAQNLCFYPSKPMVSLLKTYGFTPQ